MPKIRDNFYDLADPVEESGFFLTAAFLIMVRSGSDVKYAAYTIEGQEIIPLGTFGTSLTIPSSTGIGTTTFPEVVDNLGEGARIIFDQVSGDLITFDFLGPSNLGGIKYSYTPPASWVVTAGQQVGTEVFWWEWQPKAASQDTQARLMTSSSVKLTSPSVVETMTVSHSVVLLPDWDEVRGPDFTTNEAGLWLFTDFTGIFYGHRVRIPLSGGSSSQRTVNEEALIESVFRAGHASTGEQSITQRGTFSLPTEGGQHEAVVWDGDPENDLSSWASVGDVVDIAPDPVAGLWWVLISPFGGPKVVQYNNSGVFQQEIIPATLPGSAIGLHILKTLILIEVDEDDFFPVV